MQALLRLISYYFVIVCVVSTIWNCSTNNRCYKNNMELYQDIFKQKLVCDDGEDCYIYCTGSESCQFTTFICPKPNSVNMNVSCNIICTRGDNTINSQDACFFNTVNAYYSDLLSITGKDNSVGIENVTCPYQGQCDIDCGSAEGSCETMFVNVEKSELKMQSTGDNAYQAATVYGQNASKLTMIASGTGSFSAANIYCPNSHNELPKKCNLKYIGHDNNGFENLEVYAINSFSDISLISNGTEVYNDEYNNDNFPIMFCSSDYSKVCFMKTDDGSNWECWYGGKTAAWCNPTDSKESPTESRIAAINIILFTVIPIFVICIIIFVALFVWKRKYKQQTLSEKIVPENDDSLPSQIEIKEQTKEIQNAYETLPSQT